MTQSSAQKKTLSENNSKRYKDRALTNMVSGAQKSRSGSKDESNDRISRPRARSTSLPKRQLSRTDSTMVELTARTKQPIILRRSPELPDVSDVARNNNQESEGSRTVIYRRRGSGSVKKKLTRTDSKLMVVTSDPENLALKIESPSFTDADGSSEVFPDSLLEDLEETSNALIHDSIKGRPLRSPPILVSEHVDTQKTSVSRQQSLVGTVLQSNRKIQSCHEERQQTLPSSRSCPNLLKEPKTLDVGLVKQRLRSTKSSDARLSDTACKENMRSRSSSSSSTQLLKVPDIFTTSFQTASNYSGSVEEVHKIEAEKNNHRHSAPALISFPSVCANNTNNYPDRNSLVKSLSDNPPRDRKTTLKTLSDTRIKLFQSVDDSEPLPAPFRPIFGQIIEGVFLGNVESTFCEGLLCKHNIGSVVDVSGCPPDVVPEHKRSDVPCACGNESRHLKAFLRLCLAEANPSELREILDKTNKFIEGARCKNKSVLISCYYGNHWSVVVAIYYLMTVRGMNLRRAYSLAMIHRSDLELRSENKRFLQQTEKRLFEPGDQSLCFDVTNDNGALVPREAWADYSTP